MTEVIRGWREVSREATEVPDLQPLQHRCGEAATEYHRHLHYQQDGGELQLLLGRVSVTDGEGEGNRPAQPCNIVFTHLNYHNCVTLHEIIFINFKKYIS